MAKKAHFVKNVKNVILAVFSKKAQKIVFIGLQQSKTYINEYDLE